MFMSIKIVLLLYTMAKIIFIHNTFPEICLPPHFHIILTKKHSKGGKLPWIQSFRSMGPSAYGSAAGSRRRPPAALRKELSRRGRTGPLYMAGSGDGSTTPWIWMKGSLSVCTEGRYMYSERGTCSSQS